MDLNTNIYHTLPNICLFPYTPAYMGINHWLPLHTQVCMCIIVDIIEEIDYKNMT